MNPIFVIIGLILLLYVVFVYLIYHKKKQLDFVRSNYYIGASKKQSTVLYRLYDLLYKFPLTNIYIKNIYKRFEFYCPESYLINKKRTMQVSLFVWCICLLEILLYYGTNPTLLKFVISIIVIYIINAECIYFVLRRTEINLYLQMVKFFEDVRHYYYQHKNINFAIEDATKEAKREIKAHAAMILDVLDSKDMEKSIRKYNEIIKISYLKLFLSICVQVKSNGDTYLKDESTVFEMNLNHLKREIQNEVLKMKKIIFLFSGLIFMEASPILVIEAFKGFGLSLLPELHSFYEGTAGIIICIVSVVLVVVCYILLTLQRDISKSNGGGSYILLKITEVYLIKAILDNYTEKFYTKVLRLKQKLKEVGEKISYRQFIVKQFIFAIMGLILAFVVIDRIHDIKKYSYLNSVIGIDKQVSSATKVQKDLLVNSIKEYTQLYADKSDISVEQIMNIIDREGKISKGDHAEVLKLEVGKRIIDYRNEYFKWYELLICILICIFFYYIPYLALLYKLDLGKKNMEQEVVQFQSIILMLMYIPNISILDLLEMMEKFSNIFKGSLQNCINEFSSGSDKALENLKKAEPYESFNRIVDGFISSDSIGIIRAFDEINSDRVYFLQRRKDEDEVEIHRKTDSATLLAYVPLVFIFGFYLIVPFMIQCYEDYMMISQSMNTLP